MDLTTAFPLGKGNEPVEERATVPFLSLPLDGDEIVDVHERSPCEILRNPESRHRLDHARFPDVGEPVLAFRYLATGTLEEDVVRHIGTELSEAGKAALDLGL